MTAIEFKGKTSEYFGIWIVNLLLSILTLGIYSAWAKVRDKKYFYHHTRIDGAPFGYHAKPMAILKGRLIAFALFVLYQVVSQYNFFLSMGLLVLFSLAVPWIIVRGLIFNARNSSHRGLRFDFNGRLKDSIKVFFLYPMLYVVSFGLAYPFVTQRVHRFMFNHHKFGATQFKMDASVKAFYKIYLKVFASILGAIMITVLASSAIKPLFNDFVLLPEPNAVFQQLPAETSHQQPSAKRYAPEATLLHAANDTQTEQASKDPIKQLLDSFKDSRLMMFVMPFLFFIVYGLVISLVLGYVKARTSNLLWNHTQIDHISFISNQRARDLCWIYLTNMLAIALTLGLATPWAKIRLAKYRAQHLLLEGETDWDRFVGEKKAESKALGEEMADMFDVDISFI